MIRASCELLYLTPTIIILDKYYYVYHNFKNEESEIERDEIIDSKPQVSYKQESRKVCLSPKHMLLTSGDKYLKDNEKKRNK